MDMQPSTEVILTVMRKMSPLLQIQPVSDNELLAIWNQMSQADQELMFKTYGSISWNEWQGGDDVVE